MEKHIIYNSKQGNINHTISSQYKKKTLKHAIATLNKQTKNIKLTTHYLGYKINCNHNSIQKTHICNHNCTQQNSSQLQINTVSTLQFQITYNLKSIQFQITLQFQITYNLKSIQFQITLQFQTTYNLKSIQFQIT